MVSKEHLLLVCEFLYVGILKIMFQVTLLGYMLYPKLHRGDDTRVEGTCRRLLCLKYAGCVVSKKWLKSKEMRPVGFTVSATFMNNWCMIGTETSSLMSRGWSVFFLTTPTVANVRSASSRRMAYEYKGLVKCYWQATTNYSDSLSQGQVLHYKIVIICIFHTITHKKSVYVLKSKFHD